MAGAIALVHSQVQEGGQAVSDTPRTDSLLTAILDLDGYVAHRNCPPQWVYYARELERELNAANESFRKLNIHALDLAARIKRLEEAGDAIVDHNIGCGCGQDGPCRACRMACEAWYKAKEAKP